MAGRVEDRRRDLGIVPVPNSRMAVGVSALPYDVAVEVEAVFKVR